MCRDSTAFKNRHDSVMEITVWAQKTEIIVYEHMPCHQQMQVKALWCEEEAICEHDPETLPSSLGQSLFEWTGAKWETILMSEEFEI